jgi:hypothetical protein
LRGVPGAVPEFLPSQPTAEDLIEPKGAASAAPFSLNVVSATE